MGHNSALGVLTQKWDPHVGYSLTAMGGAGFLSTRRPQDRRALQQALAGKNTVVKARTGRYPLQVLVAFSVVRRLPGLVDWSVWEYLDCLQKIHPAAGTEPTLQCKMDVLALKKCRFLLRFKAAARRRQTIGVPLSPVGTGFFNATWRFRAGPTSGWCGEVRRRHGSIALVLMCGLWWICPKALHWEEKTSYILNHRWKPSGSPWLTFIYFRESGWAAPRIWLVRNHVLVKV